MRKTIPFWLCLVSSISLLVSGFCVPPMGVIDGSVLQGVGILFGFAALAQIPTIIEVAGHVRMIHGNTILEASVDPLKHDPHQPPIPAHNED